MKPSLLPIHRLELLLAVAAICGAASPLASAATLRGSQPVVAMQPVPKPLVLPARDDILTIDWIDAKTSRIAIGGITYALRNVQPRIVLADGQEATHIAYLKAGMHAHIDTATDPTGGQRLVAIRVAP